jgi:hypothetical protein
VPSFKPEQWHLIPTDPRFGSVIDSTIEKNIHEQVERKFDTRESTEMGIIQIHQDAENLNIFAEDYGIGLNYDKQGKLTDAGVDILNYSLLASDDNFEKMGGENLHEMLEAAGENDEQILVSIDLNGKALAVATVERSTGKGTILSSAENLNVNLATLMRVEYDDYVLYVGFVNVEDEFHFGLKVVTEDEDEKNPERSMVMTRILSELNYQTFMSMPTVDKYDKLVKRIFLT